MIGDSALAGKIILVSGGSRGIGRAIVESFAAEGADVFFFYRENAAAAREIVETARCNARPVVADQADVRDADACAAAVDKIQERCGRIEVLVNNSGVARD